MACRHEQWEKVESVVTGDHLATICTNCLDEMPLHYSGEVTEIHRFGALEPVAYIPRPSAPATTH